jgi:glycosyltransferase involved in cell wall biosynthesis
MPHDSSRIGIVTTSFPRCAGDAAGSFVLGMARELSRRGHLVEVVAPEPRGPADWGRGAEWLEEVEVFAAPYVRPRRLARLFFGAGVPDNLARAPWLAALVPPAVAGLAAAAAARGRCWDAVVSHWLLPSAPVAGSMRRRGARHLAIAHSGDVHLLGRAPLGGAVARWIARSADHVGFVSRRLERRFLDLADPGGVRRLEGKTAVTPMGIDLEGLVADAPRAELRDRLGLDRSSVLCLGRLVPIKGVDVAIEALAGAEGTRLVVAGDGPERGRLEALARSRGADVAFLGAVDPERRAALLAACDAAVIPSRVTPGGREEGLPLALVEALGAGLPVVATRTGAMDELVEDGVSGLLVPPDDAAALGAAVERLGDDRELATRLGAEGRRRVENRDWRKLGDLYEELLFGPPPRPSPEIGGGGK